MKRAIVLSGGGSLGAYELGAWTSLLENDISYSLVTGTSIGALNGAMMAQKDYDLAKNVWSTLSLENIMQDGINLERSIDAMWNHREKLMPFLKKYIAHKGADITPFINLLDRVINEDRLRASDIEFGLVTLTFPSLKPLEMTKADIPLKKLKNFLLASASCFPAFPMCKIDGESYIDGGYYDNLPINFALKQGADNVIAVDLKTTPVHPKFLKNPLITYIHPRWELGSFLMFNQTVMANNTLLGYLDTQKAFQKFVGYRYAFYPEFQMEFFKTASEKLVALIFQIEANLADVGKTPLLKVSWNPLSALAEKYVEKQRLSSEDYLIRSLETFAELLGLDYHTPYHVSELIQKIADFLSQLESQTPSDLPVLLKNLLVSAESPENMRSYSQQQVFLLLLRLLKEKKISQELLLLSSVFPKETFAFLGYFFVKNA